MSLCDCRLNETELSSHFRDLCAIPATVSHLIRGHVRVSPRQGESKPHLCKSSALGRFVSISGSRNGDGAGDLISGVHRNVSVIQTAEGSWTSSETTDNLKLFEEKKAYSPLNTGYLRTPRSPISLRSTIRLRFEIASRNPDSAC